MTTHTVPARPDHIARLREVHARLLDVVAAIDESPSKRVSLVDIGNRVDRLAEAVDGIAFEMFADAEAHAEALAAEADAEAAAWEASPLGVMLAEYRSRPEYVEPVRADEPAPADEPGPFDEPTSFVLNLTDLSVTAR